MGDDESRAGSGYADAPIVAYCDRVHAREDQALEHAFNAPAQHHMPPIMVGHSEAKFLQILVQIHQPKKSVEVGTLAGFSAISMGRKLTDDGHLWTIENDAHHVEVARRNIENAGLSHRITVVHADALDGLRFLAEEAPFDLVFLDADKERYDQYQAWASVNLRTGGLLIADNAYYFGHLLDETMEAAAVRTMHERTAEAFDSVCVPTPDGLVLAIKT
jgi:caffeoyl-CoA O-methyltransferase